MLDGRAELPSLLRLFPSRTAAMAVVEDCIRRDAATALGDFERFRNLTEQEIFELVFHGWDRWGETFLRLGGMEYRYTVAMAVDDAEDGNQNSNGGVTGRLTASVVDARPMAVGSEWNGGGSMATDEEGLADRIAHRAWTSRERATGQVLNAHPCTRETHG